mgnify:FL=1
MDEIFFPEVDEFDINEIEIISDNEILLEPNNESNHIGILPEPDAILSNLIVPLFGILAQWKEREEDCHFCLQATKESTNFVIQTPCCKHLAHADCFQEWAESKLNETSIRCAYCRAKYNPHERCFLCLLKLDEEITYTTRCCHTKVHQDCAKELKDLDIMLLSEHTIECGQLNKCRCLWINV